MDSILGFKKGSIMYCTIGVLLIEGVGGPAVCTVWEDPAVKALLLGL